MAKLSPDYAELELVAEVTKKAFHIGPLQSISTALLRNCNDPFPPSHLLCLDQGQPSSISFAPCPALPAPNNKTEMGNEEAVGREGAGEVEETRAPASRRPGQASSSV